MILKVITISDFGEFIAKIGYGWEFPAEAVADPANWVSCIAGAELKSTYIARLEKAGFADIKITSETPYQFDAEWSSRVHSMAITARKG